MNLPRKTILGLVSLVTAFGLTLGFAPQVQAAACTVSGKACVWNAHGWNGDPIAIMTVPTNTHVGSCVNLPSNAKNVGSSVANLSSRTLYWYDGDNCSGAQLLVEPAHNFYDLRPAADNKIQSFWVNSDL